MKKNGWTGSGRYCGGEWTHASGAKVTHCGHQTALYPFLAYRADGSLVNYGHDEKGRPIAMHARLTEAQDAALETTPL